MNEKHYKEELSRFVNHELPNDERQELAEHLLQCADCRAEHDEIKFAAALAANLTSADAPENVWTGIENALDKREEKRFLFPFFGSPAIAAAAGLLLVVGLIAAVYFGLNRNPAPQTAQNETPAEQAPFADPPIGQAPVETSPIPTETAKPETAETNVPVTPPDSNIEISPKRDSNPRVARDEAYVAANNLPSWNVETLAGQPKIGNSFDVAKIAVGQVLETDANSRARVQVANIGNVDIAPNTRVQLVGTKSTEHRLSLELGLMHAKILAPPRLFIVDTPSAVAVDLGCEYTLEVDKDGNSRLHVTSGYVSLERGGRESIVPAGAIALTKKGKGVGTPFSEDSSAEFQKALTNFDFENGGSGAIDSIIKESQFYDTISLWHLLSRTRQNDREKVFDALSKYVKPPVGTTRAGLLKLDKQMLDRWWIEIETIWFQ